MEQRSSEEEETSMISLAYMIFVAVVAGFLALIATFLRLMVEDWEAVEIDEDEIERLE